MITIVDYGLGNINAFLNIYKRLNIKCNIAKNNHELQGADKLILPGVGSFDYAMQSLDASGMRECLEDLVLMQQRPILGICVGMQMMACRSDEGQLRGLGWINAEVRRFDESKFESITHLPHMGWNDVVPNQPLGLFRDLDLPMFYFLHSYYFETKEPGHILAKTIYGIPFASAVNSKNIYGVQFHPEKSHNWGIQLLKNFADI